MIAFPMSLVEVVTSGDTVKLRQSLINHDININSRLESGDTLLHLAVTSGRCDIIEVLLEHGADACAVNTSGENSLHRASALGLVEIVCSLYDHGGDLGMPTSFSNESNLHLAVQGGHVDLVNFLLQHSANTNAITRLQQTPISLAIDYGGEARREIVQALIQGGASVNGVEDGSGSRSGFESGSGSMSRLGFGSRSGPVAKTEPKVKVRVGARAEVWEGYSGAWAEVEAKARSGDWVQEEVWEVPEAVGAARTLGSAWARDRTTGTNNGDISRSRPRSTIVGELIPAKQAPLHLAVSTGDMQLVGLLLAAGADVNAPDRHGSTALHLAAERSDVDTVEQLLTHGADADCKGGLLEEVRPWIGEHRLTPLHIAASRGNSAIVRALIYTGADIDMSTTDFATLTERPWCWIVHKETALHLAAEGGHTDLVKLLVQHGADMANIDVEGNMPHHLCLHSARYDTLHALLVRGCRINEKDGDQCAALHQAVRIGDQSGTSLLLAHGAALTPHRKYKQNVVRSLLQMLAGDRTADPDLFPAVYYSGNTVSPPLLHDAPVELLELKRDPDRAHVYDWLCAQGATVQPLMVLCRWHIRRGFLRTTNTKSIWILVENLPVPRPIKRYLLLTDYNKYPVQFEVCPVVPHRSQSSDASPLSLGFNY